MIAYLCITIKFLKGGKGGKDDDDDDDDTKGDGEILAELGETLAKRMFRIKRRAQGEPLPSVSPSLDPFSRPSSGATGGPSWRPSGKLVYVSASGDTMHVLHLLLQRFPVFSLSREPSRLSGKLLYVFAF